MDLRRRGPRPEGAADLLGDPSGDGDGGDAAGLRAPHPEPGPRDQGPECDGGAGWEQRGGRVCGRGRGLGGGPWAHPCIARSSRRFGRVGGGWLVRLDGPLLASPFRLVRLHATHPEPGPRGQGVEGSLGEGADQGGGPGERVRGKEGCGRRGSCTVTNIRQSPSPLFGEESRGGGLVRVGRGSWL